MAVTSGKGSRPRPVNVSAIAVVPTTPRHRCDIGFAVFSPSRRLSCCSNSQPRITGTAKIERKKTVSPAGTVSDTAFTIADMHTNTATDAILRKMPRRKIIRALYRLRQSCRIQSKHG